MKLTREQSQKLLHERGIWITNACDKCGQLLGAVRWTRKDEDGEWCSAECRDGVKAKTKAPVAVALEVVRPKRIGARSAGRPKKHTNNAEKCRSYRERCNSVAVTRNTPSQSIENTQVPAAKNRSHVVGLILAAQALETALGVELPETMGCDRAASRFFFRVDASDGGEGGVQIR